MLKALASPLFQRETPNTGRVRIPNCMCPRTMWARGHVSRLDAGQLVGVNRFGRGGDLSLTAGSSRVLVIITVSLPIRRPVLDSQVMNSSLPTWTGSTCALCSNETVDLVGDTVHSS